MFKTRPAGQGAQRQEWEKTVAGRDKGKEGRQEQAGGEESKGRGQGDERAARRAGSGREGKVRCPPRALGGHRGKQGWFCSIWLPELHLPACLLSFLPSIHPRSHPFLPTPDHIPLGLPPLPSNQTRKILASRTPASKPGSRSSCLLNSRPLEDPPTPTPARFLRGRLPHPAPPPSFLLAKEASTPAALPMAGFSTLPVLSRGGAGGGGRWDFSSVCSVSLTHEPPVGSFTPSASLHQPTECHSLALWGLCPLNHSHLYSVSRKDPCTHAGAQVNDLGSFWTPPASIQNQSTPDLSPSVPGPLSP